MSAAANSNPILRFEPNTPIMLALKYRTGRPCKSPHTGPQVLYTTTEGFSMFVPPSVEDELLRLKIEPGERVSICKKQEAGSATEWEVLRIDPPKAPAPPDLRPPVSPTLVDSAAPSRKPPVGTHHITPPPVESSLNTAQSQNLLRQLVATVEVVHAVEQYAERIGRPIQFFPEDVRALAISAFIQQSRGV